VRRRLRKARNRYGCVLRAGGPPCAAAEALLEYAYVLEFLADQSADVSLDARNMLAACIRQLDTAVLMGGPAPVMEEYVASLDEQTMYIEVALHAAVCRTDVSGVAA
jgi:hypothetical protein